MFLTWFATGVIAKSGGPSQGLSPPLLRERARLLPPGPRAGNLFTTATDFSNAYWTKTSCSISSGTPGAPDGQVVTETTDGGNTSHRLQRSLTFSAGVHTVEFELKPLSGGRDWVRPTYNGASLQIGHINIATGQVGNLSAGCAIGMQRLEDDWVRVTFIFTAAAETVTIRLDLASSSTTTSYTGDGRNAFRIREAYLVAGDNSLGVITQGAPGSGQSLTPPFVVDGDLFFTPAVTTGPVGLSGAFLRDGDQLLTPTLSVGAVALLPPLHRDQDRFFGPTVTRGAVALAPALLRDQDRFFAPTLTRGAVALAPALLRDQDRFFTHAVALGDVDLLPPLLRDEDRFFGFTVTNVGDPGALEAGSDVGGQTVADLFVPDRPAELYRVVARTR